MPQNHPNTSSAGLTPVPLTIFLHPSHHRRHTPPTDAPAPAPPDWCGVQPNDAAHLIAAYTRRGDLVIDLDAHPTITRAARYLGRQPVHLLTAGQHRRLLPAPPARRILGRHGGAGLVLARLPRTGADSLDLHAMTQAMQSWRTLLRPGGHLLTALSAHGPETASISHRCTVITAARTAGLTWQQEFLILRAPLPDYEPRAMPDTAATALPALLDGRHEVIHVKVLAFRNETGDVDA
jgi:hypothetical protein